MIGRMIVRMNILFTVCLFSPSIFGMVPKQSLDSLLKKEISQFFSGASIELNTPVRWTQGRPTLPITSVSVLGSDGQGRVQFSAWDDSGSRASYGWVDVSAWMPARIALRRIHPGESLVPSLFTSRRLDVSKGQSYEYRGVLVSENTEVSGLETLQTVLEGQTLTNSAVRRIPSVRRGDFVRIHIQAGGIDLSTQGIAEEPGYLDRQIRVMTGKTKRELMGVLQAGGVVEVKL